MNETTTPTIKDFAQEDAFGITIPWHAGQVARDLVTETVRPTTMRPTTFVTHYCTTIKNNQTAVTEADRRLVAGHEEAQV